MTQTLTTSPSTDDLVVPFHCDRCGALAKVRVAFGTPISPQRYAAMPAGRARRELTDEIMLAIATLSGQERVDAYNELPPGSDPAIGV